MRGRRAEFGFGATLAEQRAHLARGRSVADAQSDCEFGKWKGVDRVNTSSRCSSDSWWLELSGKLAAQRECHGQAPSKPG